MCDGDVQLEDFEEEVNSGYSLTSSQQVMDLERWPVVETCLMTPPKKTLGSLIPWTPTANLKLLLKAASPDLRMRDLKEAKVNVKTKSKISKKKKQVIDNAELKSEDLGNAVVQPTNMTGEWADFGKRKEKSLGLLCHRY